MTIEVGEPIVTRTVVTWLDTHGILWARHAAGSEQTLTEATENVAAALRLTGGKRWPLLIDMSAVKSINREARQYYAGPATAAVASAYALVVGSPLSRVIGNFFIGLNKTAAPTRLFNSCDEARVWLGQFIAAS
jgi:hypothetical protein